jgi:hypothetical protein
MIIPSEEMENQEDMESNVIVGEGEEEESKEEETETNPVEEASKGEDDRKGEEEENKEEEGQEMIKHSEEMENQEEMESYVIIEEGEGEESKEEETETNPVAVDNSQERRNSPQGQDKTDVDHEQDDQTNNAELDMGSESEKAATPAEIPASPSSLNLAEAVDDEQTSGDELVMFTRRVYFEKKKKRKISH